MWHGAGPSPDLQAGCQEGYFLLLLERASHPKRGLLGFPRPPRPAAPLTVQCPPGLPEVLPAPPASPPPGAPHPPLSSLPLPTPPAAAAALAAASYAPEPPGRRGWARGPPGLLLHALRRPHALFLHSRLTQVSWVCPCLSPSCPSCHRTPP